MATLITCDKCGEEIDGGSCRVTVRFFTGDNPPSRPMDLCKSCVTKFRVWIEAFLEAKDD